jgi:hypothetical protein
MAAQVVAPFGTWKSSISAGDLITGRSPIEDMDIDVSPSSNI